MRLVKFFTQVQLTSPALSDALDSLCHFLGLHTMLTGRQVDSLPTLLRLLDYAYLRGASTRCTPIR